MVIITQLATKLVKPDGTPGTFDDLGARAAMVPQPGMFPALDPLLAGVAVTKSLFYLIFALSDSGYLQNGKSYRIIIIPQTRTSGSVHTSRGARARLTFYPSFPTSFLLPALCAYSPGQRTFKERVNHLCPKNLTKW